MHTPFISAHARHFLARPCALILLGVFLAGCGTTRAYQGEKRSSDQVALIRRETPIGQAGDPLSVIRIDGKKVGGVGTEIEVLPGRHQIHYMLTRMRPMIWALVEEVVGKDLVLTPPVIIFEAEAGHLYRLRAQKIPDEKYTVYSVWIEDAKSNTFVGGNPPIQTDPVPVPPPPR